MFSVDVETQKQDIKYNFEIEGMILSKAVPVIQRDWLIQYLISVELLVTNESRW